MAANEKRDVVDSTKRNMILDLASRRGVLRTEDFERLGVSRRYVRDLVDRGDLSHLGRGMFASPTFERSEHHALVEVVTHSPRSIICLVSALQFHELTTQLPPFVWIALPNNIEAPKVPTVGIELVHMNSVGLTTGVDHHEIEGVQVPIFSAAKTIADCFKYRGRVTTSVAIEALKDCLKKRKATRSEIIVFAKAIHSWSVMRPYMEMVS